MSHISISASHIQRKNADNQSDSNGYNMVDDGLVAIKTATGIALIFKRSNWDIYGHKVGGADLRKLKIDMRMHPVQFIKTHSSFLNHSGATIIITGTFDRKVAEVITIKTTRNDAKLVRKVLKRLNL